jgi:hypothetical protein
VINATAISPGPSTGVLLDELLVSRFLPRRWAYRVWTAAQLPSRLLHCVRNLGSNAVWRAYGDQEQLFFAVARAPIGEPHSRSSAAIEVYFLDGNAAVYSAGVWEHDSKHGWWLDSVPELSYDCEHGWWLDALIDRPASTDSVAPAHPAAVVALRRVPALPAPGP